MAARPAAVADALSRIDTLLRLFAEVRTGEGGRVLALAANAFLILTAYYVMKPVREALILDQPGGAKLKSYAYAMQAVLLLAAIPIYSRLATQLPRWRLITNSRMSRLLQERLETSTGLSQLQFMRHPGLSLPSSRPHLA